MPTHAVFLRARILSGLLSALLFGACGGGDGGTGPVTPPPAVTISVSPTTSTVDAGGSATFSATVTNATNTAVTWTASGGTVAGSGNTATWTAPLSGGPFTVTATSVAAPAKSASATVTVRAVAVTVSPTTRSVLAGETSRFTATVANSANTGVTWSASGGTIIGASTSAAVDWMAPASGGSYTLTATSTADPAQSATVTVTVAPVAVIVSADSASVSAGGTRTLTAMVTGAADTAVTWTAEAGTISGSGSLVTWTAPVVGGVYDITATSVLDTSMHSTVSITVRALAVSISSAPRAYFRGETANFTATVTGAAPGRDSVVWSSTCGPVMPNGLSVSLSAPMTAGSCDVSVRSAFDATKVATTSLMVRDVWRVSNATDASDGACTFGDCSLREALIAANAAPDADSILLVGTPGTPVTITLTSALPTLETPIALVGPGSTMFTIDAAGGAGMRRRALTIRGAVAVSVSGVTITGGYENDGGGLLVDSGATVMLDAVTVRDNIGSTGGGAAVYGGSRLEVNASLFEGNQADDEDYGNGGALYAGGQSMLTVTGGVLRENSAHRGGGVGAEESGVTLNAVTIEDNTSNRSGGGVSLRDAGTLTITGGVLRNNRSTNSVGGGMIAYATSTSPTDRVTLVMQDVLVENNSASDQGGGLQITRNVEATLTRVIVRGNELRDPPSGSSPVFGGGIYSGNLVNLTLEQSTIANNRILSAVSTSVFDGGAGLAVGSDLPTTLTISNTTISGNESSVRGGGLFVGGAPVTTITNSTISGNSAPTGAGALIVGTATLRNATIMANRATVAGAGLMGDRGARIQIENSLLADNLTGVTGSDCVIAGGAAITSLGHNLSDDASCASFNNPGDLANTSAGAASALANNGGPTFTHALLAGSAAINAASDAACSVADQRGFARVGICDMGAVEFGATAPAVRASRVVGPTARHAFRLGAPRRMSTRTTSAMGEGEAHVSRGAGR